MMNKLNNLIHIGKFFLQEGMTKPLFLRKMSPQLFHWFEVESDGFEKETPISASTIEEAIRLARKQWRYDSFSTLHCGFRYMLPERDEHGINALFFQMAASYSSPTGVYFDDVLGNNCFVQNASAEARTLWKKLADQSHVK
jgi:hypothetical protein